MTEILPTSQKGKAIAGSNSLVDLAARIRTHHEATVAALSSAVMSAMAAGDLLIEAKAALPHGQWLPWLADNCPHLSERSAQLYIKLAKHRPVIPDLELDPAGLVDQALVATETFIRGAERRT